MRPEIEQWARTAAALMLIATLAVLTIIVMTRHCDCDCSPVEPASSLLREAVVSEAGLPTQPPLNYEGAQVWDLTATTTTPPPSTSMSPPAEKATG